MRKLLFLSVFIAFVNLFVLGSFFVPAFAAEGPTLKEGIAEYSEENYEEAIEILTEVRRHAPESSEAAFFLGMAYKQAMNYEQAEVNLRDAVTLTPKIKEALLELADVLYQKGDLDEARRWLSVAEEEGFFPARTAFLKGMILARENKNMEAVATFEKAKELDQALTQAAEFQIALCLVKERKLDLAKARLQAVVERDPLSDLATFARQYQEMVEERLYLERPLHLTVGILAGLDSNIITKPLEGVAAANMTDEKGTVLSSSVRVDYVPRLEGPWLFNAQYSAASNVNSRHTHSHDSFANSFSVSPGYNFGHFTLNLNAGYTNVLLRTDPDLVPAADSDPGYKRYLDYTTIGPALRILLNQNNLLEVFAGYDKKEYYNQKQIGPDENRDAVGPRTYISWIWLFRENSFLNLRYDYTKENADGRNYSNHGNRLTANLSFPVTSEETARSVGPVTMQLTGSAFFQDYEHEVAYTDGIKKRRDDVYTGSVALTWKFWKHASLITQYIITESQSNVEDYGYNRDQLFIGFEFRY